MSPPKIVFYDSYLDSLKDKLGDGYVKVCLSPVSYRMISRLSEMLLWKTRYPEVDGISQHGWLAYDQFNAPIECESEPSEGEIDMTKDELLEWINGAIEDMTINVTQTVNCGCCDGVATSTTTTDDTPPDGYDIPVIEPDEPDVYVNEAEKCDRATYLMVQYRNACLTAVQGIEGGFTAFGDWADDAVGWILTNVGLVFSYDVYMYLREWMSLGAFTNTDDLISAYDPNFDSMVCSIVSSDTPAQAKTAVRGILESFVWSEVSPYARLAYKKIFELLPFDLVFDYDAVATLPPGYIGRSCCGGAVEQPYVPVMPSIGDYVLEPVTWTVTASEPDNEYNSVLYNRSVNDGNGISYSCQVARNAQLANGKGEMRAYIPSVTFLNGKYANWEYIGLIVEDRGTFSSSPEPEERESRGKASGSTPPGWEIGRIIHARQASSGTSDFIAENPDLDVRYVDDNIYGLSSQPDMRWTVLSPNDAEYTQIEYSHRVEYAMAVYKVT